jgi:molybdopterin-guanine dinucleotide biosynthesis protein A
LNLVAQNDFSGFVLAGGASSRMGTDKALLKFGDRTLVEHALMLLASLDLSPRIVGSREDLARYAPVVADLRPGCGPLSGIEAGLLASKTEYALFIPVDLPLLPAVLLRQMMDRVLLTEAKVTVPRFLGHEQPLCAIFHRDLLPAISDALSQGDYKVMRVVERAALALGGAQVMDRYDVETAMTVNPRPLAGRLHRAFLNCNTPGDFRRLGQQLQ